MAKGSDTRDTTRNANADEALMVVAAHSGHNEGGGPQLKRPRRDGFSEAKQRAFLTHLAATANVTESLSRVDLSAQSLYALRRRSAAFRAEWDAALAEGYAKLETMLLDRAINGHRTTVVTNGVANETVSYSERLALNLLTQHRRRVTEYRAATMGTLDDPDAVRARVMGKLEAIARALGLA